MRDPKPFLKIAVPGVAALLAIAIATGMRTEGRAHEIILAPIDGPTPYSADHARAQRTAPDEEPSPTF